MGVYVLLVMWISSVMGMGMPISSMVMPHMVMSARSMMPRGVFTITVIDVFTTMMVRMHSMCMVYVVMGSVVSTRGVMVTIINMVWS